MERLEGVKDVKATFEKGEVVLTYDPQKITVERLIETVNGLGYKASLKSPEGG